MEQITCLVRPTLGPVGGAVAIAGPTAQLQPEILTDAATIARRVIQIDDPFADMGAMLLRQLLWQVHEQVGGGSAMAAVLCTSMIREGYVHLAAGCTVSDIRRGLDRGIQIVAAHLQSQARTVRLPSELAAIAYGSLSDAKLASMVGEVVEAVGADGVIRVEDTHAATSAYDYVQGSRWASGCLSYALMPPVGAELLLPDPIVVVAADQLDLLDLVPVVEHCVATDVRSLLVIAPSLTDSAVGLLVRNREAGILRHVMAVGVPGHGSHRQEALGDISAISGARCVRKAAGECPGSNLPVHLGRVRQAWATRHQFGLLGGGGNIGEVRQRAGEARQRLLDNSLSDAEQEHQQARLATLVGASAIVRIGAPTRAAQRSLRSRVEAAIRTVRAAYRDGVVPGAGTTLVGALPELARLSSELPDSEAAGVRMLMRAVEEPLRWILINGATEPEPVLSQVRELGTGAVYDVRMRCWVDPWASGILDPVTVLTTALSASASTAMMALSTDVLVRRSNPPISILP